MTPLKKSIFLCGFMGCGKTAAGKSVSAKMGINFIDLDEFIENTAEKSIADIFAQDGEEVFRRMESVAIAKICEVDIKMSPHIIALGGGAAADELNAALVNANGISVFIDTEFETCYERIKNDTSRPLAKSREFLEQLYNQRRQVYIKNCEIIIDGNTDVQTLSERILNINL